MILSAKMTERNQVKVREYKPLPPRVNSIVKRKWQQYRQLFGLEGDIAYGGLDEVELRRALEERKVNLEAMHDDWKKEKVD